MSCVKPLIRFYVPNDREKSGRVYTLDRFRSVAKNDKIRYEDLVYRKDVMLIPCGQCIGCRIQQREDWTTRIELEARDWNPESVWFITLTYDEEHVPGMILGTGEIVRNAKYTWDTKKSVPESVQILLYPDIQKFLKRLRKALGGKLRYFCCGEYGDKTARPHYHMILYGWIPSDLEDVYKGRPNGYYTSKFLEECWGMGQIMMANAKPATYRYVAGYVTKKMYELGGRKQNEYEKLGQPKPFAEMSRKPGLGDNYYEKHKNEIWEQGYIQCSNGKKARMPRA